MDGPPLLLCTVLQTSLPCSPDQPLNPHTRTTARLLQHIHKAYVPLVQ